MSIRAILVGTLVGYMTGSSFVGTGPAAVRPVVAYADDCSTIVSYHTGSYSYSANAGAARAWINTIGYPSSLCSNDTVDNSYWTMVNGTDAVYIYAQVGWTVEGAAGFPTTPHVFYERSYTSHYDPGDLLGSQISNTSAHTYEVQVYRNNNDCGSPGDRAGFWFDNNWLNDMCIDWYTGSGVQMAAETHLPGNRLGTVEFGDTQYCTQSSPGSSCRANTTYVVTNSNTESPANPYGCYWKKNSNDFEVYDSRGNGGSC